MMVRRLALFFAMLCGLMMTQVPEFAEQYQQRLGGAIDELSAIVARFDSDSAAQGLTEDGGIERLLANSDEFVRQRGTQMREISARLVRLQDVQQMLRNHGPAERLVILATHYDSSIAARAFESFQPAVPVSAEAFVLGLIGFIGGGGAVHAAGYSFKRKLGRRPRKIPSESI
ncbi:MAG: DUF2937 family protein [Beijerinckiaceae bacterium]|nr:DUF2937 family protein [Beijerinckiaceae bacterium]